MTNIHHSRHVSTWIIDAYHSGIVYDHRPGEFRYLVETRIGRAIRHTSAKSFRTERAAVRAMFLAMGVLPPKRCRRKTRKTAPTWSRAGGEE